MQIEIQTQKNDDVSTMETMKMLDCCLQMYVALLSFCWFANLLVSALHMFLAGFSLHRAHGFVSQDISVAYL